MEKDYPFLTDYAKSDRSHCRSCKENISKDSLRLAALVQSHKFDGKMTTWFHFDCFFKKNRIQSFEDIKNVDSLRWEDQEKIRNKLTSIVKEPVLTEYTIAYSKAKATKCVNCGLIIEKGSMKISMKREMSESDKVLVQWYHIDCFHSIQSEVMKSTPHFNVANLSGFDKIKENDRQEVIDKFKNWKKSKKRAVESIDHDTIAKKKFKENIKPDDELKNQIDTLWQIRDRVQKEVSKQGLVILLEYNAQYVPIGEANLLDAVSDCMVFGRLNCCPECGGQLSFSSNKYKCRSNINEWTNCLYETTEVERSEFKIPAEYDEIEVLKNYVYIPRVRVLPKESAHKIVAPLDGYSFIVDNIKFGDGYTRPKIVKQIKELGGTVLRSVSSDCTAIISDNDHPQSQAKEYNIDVVTPKFLDNLETEGFIDQLKEHSIMDWGRSKEELYKLKTTKLDVGSLSFKEEDKIQFLTVKGGTIVDPDSKLEDKAHIYREKKSNDPLNAILGMVNLVKGSNSFYKLQLLESDTRKKWWVFRSWGRIGTTIGGNKKESFDDLQEAVDNFNALYLDKTGNEWRDRHNFRKQPNKFYPMDVDYGEGDCVKELSVVQTESALPDAVQRLIQFIFDIDSMKKAMLVFEIDLKKMPLGKLSKKQIDLSYAVLNELQQLLLGSEPPTKSKLLDASTRFYTLMPHDFGMRAPPIIDSLDVIKSKSEMIDNLREMEIAYKMLNASGGENSIEKCYGELHNNINIVAKESSTYQRIDKYLQNTHADTHKTYTLEIIEIFDVARENEDVRFSNFSKLPNRMMLWHGSRRTNWAGILSQGLRIAPPEAPVSGYMFGKGIYFADMVSKSANYCATNAREPEGLLLLCEVALGNMTERVEADECVKLNTGENSCKGVGATIPDPEQNVVDENGVIFPMGTAVTTKRHRGSLLYNEYIVYDVGQVRQRYLLRVRFNYKSRR